MSTRAALLLCVCAVAEGAKKGGFQKIPQFYTSTDCTGDIDAASKTWSMDAKDGVAVQPFMTEGAYLEGWAVNKCLAVSGLTYSVKLMINETACANNNEANQFVLNYYAGSMICGSTPTVTPLTLDQCVTYARGSVKLVAEISLPDICIGTDYLVKMATGGIRTQVWGGATCTGTPIHTSLSNDDKECGAEPECDGCCASYDDCVIEANKHEFTLSACQKKNNAWEFGMRIRDFNDSACTEQLPDAWMGEIILIDTCHTLNASIINGTAMVTFLSPMTEAIQCGLMEMALRNNIDASIVSWSELNAGVAAVPHILALVAVVFAALL